MDKTVYVVSGFMRTGTSMMMAALEAGGMDAVKRRSRDKMRKMYADNDYDPNPGGLYELEKKDYHAFGFPRKYKGKVLKALNLGVPRMAVIPEGIRVVFMRRDSEEVRQSFNAFFNRELKNTEHLQRNMRDVIQRINNRKDVLSCDVFWYRKVVEKPEKHFQILKDHGWNIDVAKAVSVIDPTLMRFRKENLDRGII